jgi:hypothetical protein
VSTTEGHVVAIGLRAAEYPLGGEASDAIEDIHRLGGMAIAAHPTSPKRDLAWTGWNTFYDGLEWLNADSEWRDESTPSLVGLALGYWLRPAAAVARTFDRPESALTLMPASGKGPRIRVAARACHCPRTARCFRASPFVPRSTRHSPGVQQMMRQSC